MKSFGVDITAELAAEIKKISWLAELRLDSDTYRYTDADIDLYVPTGDGPTDNLTLYLSFDEGAGLVARDKSGNGNHGALTNMEGDEWTAGVVGGGLNFDGSDDYVSVPHHSDLDFTTGNFSVAFWAEPDTGQGTNTRVVSKGEFNASGWEIFCGGGRVTLRTYQSGVRQEAYTNALDNDGARHHILVVRDGSTATFYIDGVPYANSGDNPSDPDSNTSELRIAAYQISTSVGFTGGLDEIRVYGAALTPTEARYLYKQKYEHFDMTVDGIESSADRAVDTVTLSFANASRQFAAVVMNEEIRHRRAVASFVCRDANNRIIVGPRVLYKGLISTWEMTETRIDIPVVSLFALWHRKTLRKAQVNCNWPFKGTECTYSGAETWCDQSYERCVVLSNQINFSESRFLPSLTEKDIWWGPNPV